VLRKIFRSKREEAEGGWKRLDRSFITCTLRQISVKFESEIKERRVRRPRHRWKYNIKIYVKNSVRMWTGFNWSRIVV